MSNRHRSSKAAAPGAAHPAPTKEQRRAENRKARHRTHELLAHADLEAGEDLVPPRPHHTRVDVDRHELTSESPKQRGRGGRDYRHWKQKFWKRRSSVRAERAAMTATELPVPKVS